MGANAIMIIGDVGDMHLLIYVYIYIYLIKSLESLYSVMLSSAWEIKSCHRSLALIGVVFI